MRSVLVVVRDIREAAGLGLGELLGAPVVLGMPGLACRWRAVTLDQVAGFLDARGDALEVELSPSLICDRVAWLMEELRGRGLEWSPYYCGVGGLCPLPSSALDLLRDWWVCELLSAGLRAGPGGELSSSAERYQRGADDCRDELAGALRRGARGVIDG